MKDQRRFIGEPIQTEFSGQPLLTKKSGCPDAFRWRGERFAVAELVAEWHDYARRGRMALNMTPAHAQAASRRGSRGVGRDYFTVKTSGGRVFTIYYDRAPRNAAEQAGEWWLVSEETEPESDKDRA
jgi:hypothetical protein